MSAESSPSSRRKAATQAAASPAAASSNPTALNTSGGSVPRGASLGSSSPSQDKKKKRGSTPKQSTSTATETHRINGNSSEENQYDSNSTSEPEIGAGSSDGGGLAPVSSSNYHRSKLSRRSSSSLSASGDNSSPSRRPSSKNQSSSSKSTTTTPTISSGKKNRHKPSKDAAQDSAATDSVVEFYMQGDDPMAHSLEWDSATSDSDSSAVSGRAPSPHAPHITANPAAAVPRLRRASSAAQGPVPSSASPSKSPRRDHSSRSLKSPREKESLGAADPLEDDSLVSSISSLSLDDSSNNGSTSPASVVNSFLEEELGLGGGVSPLPASASHEVYFKESGESTAVQSSAEQQPTPSSQISHATVGGLMSLLANPQSFQDKSFIDTFILSYEYFMDGSTFLKRLMGLYFVPQSSGGASPADDPAAQQQQRLFFQLRVINVLKKLIETRYFALRRDKRCYQLLRNFLRVLLKSGDDREKSLVVALRQSMKQNGEFFRAADNPSAPGTDSQSGSSSPYETNSNSSQTSAASSATAALVPSPGIPFSLGPQKTLLDYTHKDLARHLTLIEFEFWSSIKLEEFYHTAFSSKEKDKLAPNVNRFIKRFNDVSAWVASSVVLAPKKKQRVAVLTRLIQIMDELRRIRNFNGMMAFFSALSLGAIQRLKKTWKEVPSKVMQLWASASKFMDSSGGYKQYKEFIHIADPPTIPYMGFILRDLDFAEEFPTWVARDGRPDEDASSSSESRETESRTKSSKSSSKSSPSKSKKAEDPSHLGRSGANKYVNWTKMQWLAQCFGDTLRFQRTKFPFDEVKEMSEFVGDLSRHSWFLSDAELNEMSRNIEPEPNDAAVVAAALQPPEGGSNSSPNSPASKPKDKSAKIVKKKEKKVPQYEDLIRDPQLFSDFRKHLESRFNSENLLFWESVYKFKTTVDFTDAVEVRRRADEILHKFVTGTTENSRYMVGLNSSVSRDIKRQVDKGDITPIIFDRAVDEVEHVTLRPAFQDMLRVLGH